MFEPKFEIRDGGAVYGPYTEEVMRQLWSEGRLSRDAMYTAERMDDWSPLRIRLEPRAPGEQAKAARSGVSSDGRQLVKVQRSRGIYIILALLLGLLGIHNFYAGRLMEGVLQILCTAVLAVVFPLLLLAVALWVLVECFAVTTDGDGDPLG